MARASFSLAASLLAVVLLAAPTASGAEDEPAPPAAVAVVVAVPVPAVDVAAAAHASRPEVTIGIGLRGMVMPSAGLDPYSTHDLVMQGSASVGLTVLRLGNASILLLAEYAAGRLRATARGEEAALTLHRLGGAAETRYQLGRRFYLDARLAPTALLMVGSIKDGSLDRPLSSSAWTWGLDVSGGAGLLLGSTEPRGAKFWMTLDLGYMFAGESRMIFAPGAREDDPRKYGSVMLPALRPSGVTSRLGFAVAF